MVIACTLRIKIYQMDVKSALLNEILSELVYVKQPKGFENSKFHNHVYRLKKALYELNKLLKLLMKAHYLVVGENF